MTGIVVKRKFGIIKYHSHNQEEKHVLSTLAMPEKKTHAHICYTLHIADQKNTQFSLDGYHSYMSWL